MTNAPWSDADEAAFLGREVHKESRAKPLQPPEVVEGSRYAAIRRVLKAGAPLSTQGYLMGQMLLVMMDIGAEIAGLRDDVQRTNAYLDEAIVQRGNNAK